MPCAARSSNRVRLTNETVRARASGGRPMSPPPAHAGGSLGHRPLNRRETSPHEPRGINRRRQTSDRAAAARPRLAAQGRVAAVAVSRSALPRQHPRSRQRRVRAHHDAAGAGHQRRGVRLGIRPVLLRLSHVRGARQSTAAAHRRPPLDGAHPGFLGPRLVCHARRDGAVELLRGAHSARRGGGGFLPGHRALPDGVVPGASGRGRWRGS